MTHIVHERLRSAAVRSAACMAHYPKALTSLGASHFSWGALEACRWAGLGRRVQVTTGVSASSGTAFHPKSASHSNGVFSYGFLYGSNPKPKYIQSSRRRRLPRPPAAPVRHKREHVGRPRRHRSDADALQPAHQLRAQPVC